MKVSSKKAGKQFNKIDQTDCSYYFDYGKAKKFNKKKNPCTKRILRCPMEKCLSNVWLYNLASHYEEKHSQNEVLIPDDFEIDPKEIKFHTD